MIAREKVVRTTRCDDVVGGDSDVQATAGRAVFANSGISLLPCYGDCHTSHRHPSAVVLLSSPFPILTVRDCKLASLPFVDPSQTPATTDDSKLTPNCHCPVSPRYIPRGFQTGRSFLDYLSTPSRCSANTVGSLFFKSLCI